MSVDERMRIGLRQAYDALDSDVEAALVHVESGVRHQRTRRTLLLATAAAVVVVAGVVWGPGALGWLSGQDEVQPAEVPRDADGGWVRVEGTGLNLAPSGLSAVTELGGRLIAVGGFAQAGEAILASTDGVAWSPADTPDARHGLWLHGVIRGGPGLIAYGADGYGSVVWTSPDGLTWTAADPIAPSGFIRTIEVGGPGFLALGDVDEAGPAGLWTSVDGLTWQSVTPEPFGGPDEPFVADIIDTGSGLVAVGSVNHEQVGERAAVWTSVDGVSWSRVPEDPAVFGADPGIGMDHVVAGGPGLVAVGSHWPDGSVVWTSVDGQTWTRVPEQQHGLDGWVYRLFGMGGELVAVGGRPDGPAAIWTSPDGYAWEAVADVSFDGPDEPLITDVIDTSTGLVAVGTTDADFGADGPSTAAIWVREQP